MLDPAGLGSVGRGVAEPLAFGRSGDSVSDPVDAAGSAGLSLLDLLTVGLGADGLGPAELESVAPAVAAGEGWADSLGLADGAAYANAGAIRPPATIPASEKPARVNESGMRLLAVDTNRY